MTIEAILDECLEDIRQGHASMLDCLARYPEHAKQLEPLLQAAIALEHAANVKPTPEFKQALRDRIMSYSKPEETQPIRDLLCASDAPQRSAPKDTDLDSKEEESPTSVPTVPTTRRRM